MLNGIIKKTSRNQNGNNGRMFIKLLKKERNNMEENLKIMEDILSLSSTILDILLLTIDLILLDNFSMNLFFMEGLSEIMRILLFEIYFIELKAK